MISTADGKGAEKGCGEAVADTAPSVKATVRARNAI